MKRINGLSIALLTPFNSEGNINMDFLKKHIDLLIEAGTESIFIMGTTGEVMLLSIEERKMLTEKILKYVNGRVDVFVQTTGFSTELSCELSNYAEQAGASGIGVLSPLYYGYEQKEIINYYKTIANAVSDDFPVYLYNIPQCTTIDILPETVVELSKVKNIIGIKNSMNDLDRVVELVNKTSKDFDVLLGEDKLILPALLSGVKGFVSGTANAFPEIFIKIFNSFNENKLIECNNYQKDIRNIVKYFDEIPSFAFLKKALYFRGLDKVYVRKPFRELDQREKKVVKELMDDYMRSYS